MLQLNCGVLQATQSSTRCLKSTFLGQIVEEMAATCKINSYDHVQKFAKDSDTEGPSSVWSRKALLFSLSGAAVSLRCDTISAACATGLQGQWDRTPSEAQSGVPLPGSVETGAL